MQVHKCVETLAEFVQGNTSGGNGRVLMDTKLLEILDRLVQKKTLAEVESAELNQLRYAVVVLLMAMLEGTDRRVERRMLHVLNLRALAVVAGDCHTSANELKKGVEDIFKTGAESSQDKTAKQAIKVLRNIAQFMILDQVMPRSLSFCASRMASALEAIARITIANASAFERDGRPLHSAGLRPSDQD